MEPPDDGWAPAADLSAMPHITSETSRGVRAMVRESSYVRWLTGDGAWEWGVMMTLTVAPWAMPDRVEGFRYQREALRAAACLVRQHKFLRKRPVMVAAELHAWKAGVRDRWHLHMLIGGTSYAESFDRSMVEAVSADWRKRWVWRIPVGAPIWRGGMLCGMR